MSDPVHLISSSSHGQGGTIRWMGPELIAPEKFGLKKSRLTKSSDCYALSMVIYETISGNPPFYECIETAVYVKVLLGEHPSRGATFSEGLWKMMESCWTFQPDDRPSIADVLRCLRADSKIQESTPQSGGMVEMRGENQAPSDSFPTIRIGTNPPITAERNTHIPRAIRAADNRPALFLAPPWPLTTKATGGVDANMQMSADSNSPYGRMPKESDSSHFAGNLSENPPQATWRPRIDPSNISPVGANMPPLPPVGYQGPWPPPHPPGFPGPSPAQLSPSLGTHQWSNAHWRFDPKLTELSSASGAPPQPPPQQKQKYYNAGVITNNVPRPASQQAGGAPGWNQAWVPHPGWQVPANRNPLKRMPKEPDPSYFSVELSENPLGLENMHIKYVFDDHLHNLLVLTTVDRRG